MTIQELKERQTLLEVELRDIKKQIEHIQELCSHNNTSISSEYDWADQRNYKRHECHDCFDIWYTRN